jgi:3',5'-cyclic AMP phosphodiesterase CpdA
MGLWLGAASVGAAGLEQWDLNGSLASSSSGSALVSGAALPAASPQVSWTTSSIGGVTAGVASFGRGTHFRVNHALGSNGGGTRLNEYTLVLDLNTPSRPSGWAALLQSNPANTDDGDWFIDPSQRIGISGVYGGRVTDGTWARLALVVDCVGGTYRSYINGSLVQQLGGLTVDGRFSLGSAFLLFADNDQENAPGLVNSIQLRDQALSDAEILALGGPTAAGIPSTPIQPVNPLFGQSLQTNGGFEGLFSGWTTMAGRPAVRLTGVAKGSSHGGTRFLHGGLNRPGDMVVRQVIPLGGFTTNELDGAVLESEAWLRNWYPSGVFDDQVFHRVVFVDAAGREISSVRSMVAADDAWLQRSLTAVLPTGTRTLHLEVVGRHRRDADNDSMADDLDVRLRVAPAVVPPPVLTKKPMLQGVRTDAMTLIWETSHNLSVPVVEWGLSDVSDRTWSQVETLQIDASHFVHRAVITGLKAETQYVYRVRNGATVSAQYRFRTAPLPETPFVTAWWGDNHAGTGTLRTHVANILGHSPDMICVAGDMVNSGNSMSEWNDYWFKPLEHLDAAQTTPVIFARGNHDGEHALSYAYSALPGNESWYAFDFGNSRFIFLDSEADGSTSPEQLNWLRAELARPETQRAAFRVVCFHKPPWSQFWNGGGHTQEPFVINEWVPLFRSQGVDLVICGHEHAYTRGTKDGVVYVVSGGGGGALDTQRVAFWPHVKVEYSQYHFDIMSVDGRRMTWETYDPSNRLLDEFTLVSRQAEVRIERLPQGGHQLRIEGRPGGRYRIEEASSLPVGAVTWTALGEVTTGSVPSFWPVTVGSDLRFLRVVPLP